MASYVSEEEDHLRTMRADKEKSDGWENLAADAGNFRAEDSLFALLMEQVDGEIFILDEEGRFLSAGRKTLENLGLSAERLRGKKFTDLDPATLHCSVEDANRPLLESLENGKKSEHTCVFTQEDGRVRYIAAVCYPVLDPAGRASRFIYIRNDVTERQQLERHERQTEKMAAIGELATYMAHEIRNPLFSIGGFANALLRNPSLNDLAREKARIIYDESRRLDIVLSNILNFARPMEQELSTFAAETVAVQTVELMTLGREDRGINVVLEIESDLPMVRGNAANLKQSLINIVKNALEAMPDGGILNLSVKRGHNFVDIEVKDTGVGIDPSIMDRIFSPFFSTKSSGAGLGLALARKVIEEMGGDLSISSRPGQGTRVIVSMPLALAVQKNREGSPADA
ncbi:MAG: PAS domain S-box protein [Desulfovibrio sp.]|jgi:PAS domain S-box-containing protein|nr:PAS domain S-box protein [Desulfovibrio sp.]